MSTQKSFTLAVVGGDGIGPEVIAEALKVLDAGPRREVLLPDTSHGVGQQADDGGVAPGRGCYLFAVASLLSRCSLGCYSFFTPTANQRFCGEPDLDG